jgi:Tol biopolymer transport system component
MRRGLLTVVAGSVRPLNAVARSAAAVAVLAAAAATVAFPASAYVVGGGDTVCLPPTGPGPPPRPGIYDAVWAPRGPMLALTTRRTATYETTIELADSRTGTRKLLAAGESPSWSRNGRYLAIERQVEERSDDPCSPLSLQSDIFVLALDGSAVDVTNTSGENESQPAWSPDGTKIAYVVASAAGTGLAVYSLHDHVSRLLTWHPLAPMPFGIAPTASDGTPVWSPDSRQLLFERGRGWIAWDFGVWVIGVDGSGERPLARRAAYLARGAWSPDGKRIAFSRPNKTGHSRIWLMHADGTRKHPLTFHGQFAIDGGPLWAPAGMTIFFTRAHGVEAQVRSIGADGRTPGLVGPGSATSLSPDGRRVSVISLDQATQVLHGAILRIGGRGTRITIMRLG